MKLAKLIVPFDFDILVKRQARRWSFRNAFKGVRDSILVLKGGVDWSPLPDRREVSRLVFYHSHEDSPLPVRAVQKPWDNKADPNIETKTWGLFSTCMPPIRKGIVERGDTYLFFCTKWHEGRKLTGYYKLGSYVITGYTNHRGGRVSKYLDYALLADDMHFVEKPVPLEGERFSRLRLKDGNLHGTGPRLSQQLDEKMTLYLKELLDGQEDVSSLYVEKIKALEDESMRTAGGFRYPSWQRVSGFSEGVMSKFVKSS